MSRYRIPLLYLLIFLVFVLGCLLTTRESSSGLWLMFLAVTLYLAVSFLVREV